MSYKFVEVVWLDAVSAGGWENPAVPIPPAKVITRGWLINDAEEYVTLTMSIDTDNQSEVGNLWTIPRGMITEIYEIEV